jgi:hypothetical protein
MTENHLIKPHRWWYSKTGLALLAFAAIAAFFGHRTPGAVARRQFVE